MPIKGLTRRQDLTPRFPRIGKLRKGGEKVNDGFGPDLDRFRFTSDQADVKRVFDEAYAEAPRQINVYLPYKTTEENFQTWKEKHTAGAMQHRCDGEYVTRYLNPQGKYEDPAPGTMRCPGGCDEVGRLEVLIPELLEAGYVGTVTMETHSINDLVAISQALLKTEEIRNGHPLGLRGILFVLRRVPEKISTPGWGKDAGKRQRVQKWLVKIDPAPEWVALQMHVGENVLEPPEEPAGLLSDESELIVDPLTGGTWEVPEGAELKPEQVAAAMRTAHTNGEQAKLTPEEREAQAVARVEARRAQQRPDPWERIANTPQAGKNGNGTNGTPHSEPAPEPPPVDVEEGQFRPADALERFPEQEPGDEQNDPEPPPPGEEPISDGQRKVMYQRLKKLYPGNQDGFAAFRSWLKEHYGTEHSSDLKHFQASEILDSLADALKQAA